MKFSADDYVKIILGILVLFGTPAAWIFGKRQEVAASREKATADAKNAAETARAAAMTAEAAHQTSDVALMNAVRQGGVDTLKTLLEGAKSIADLTRQVQEQGEQLGRFKFEQAETIGALKLKHQEEISNLQQELIRLSAEVALLRKEIEIKDKALSDCAEVRRQKTELEAQIISVRAELEEHKRANHAFLYLWDAATTNKTDAGSINIAEDAIRRVVKEYSGLNAPPHGSVVSASVVMQSVTIPSNEALPHDDK